MPVITRKFSFLYLIGNNGHTNRRSTYYYSLPHSQFSSFYIPHFSILLTLFSISACSLFGVFHIMVDNFQMVTFLLDSSISVNYTFSFYKSILVTSGFFNRLVIVFRTFFFVLSLLTVILTPFKILYLMS